MKKRIISMILAMVICLFAGCAQPTEQLDQKPTDTTFLATVLEIHETSVLVEPVEGAPERNSADKISFGTGELENIGVEVGSVVEITYGGEIMESYPAQIRATKWAIAHDLRAMEYTETWMDKETAEKCDYSFFDHVTITDIYANCFFAQTVIPMPYQIKLNGALSEDWCVGDQVEVTYENAYYSSLENKAEVDLLTIKESDWQPQPGVAYKPVIYLYPETQTPVSVKLTLNGELTCTYPAYNGGWQVTAAPDGTLTDSKGQTYNYLYWEGDVFADWDLSAGFCVKGEDTAAFLETALARLGLNRREANEFIVYWLPLMQNNPYNIISFQTVAYTDAAKLEITPAPDTLIRVFMTWQASETEVILPAQELTAPARQGFAAIEWGGTELR